MPIDAALSETAGTQPNTGIDMSDDDFELPPHRSLRTAAPRRGLDDDIFSPPIKPTSTRPGARYAPLAPARDIDEDDEEDDDEEGAGGLRLRTEEPIRLSKEADDGAADDEQAETPEKSAWDPVPLFEPSGASGGSSPAARLSDEIAKLKQRFDEQPPQMQRWYVIAASCAGTLAILILISVSAPSSLSIVSPPPASPPPPGAPVPRTQSQELLLRDDPPLPLPPLPPPPPPPPPSPSPPRKPRPPPPPPPMPTIPDPPPPPMPPPPPPIDRINARYARSPFAAWPSDHSLSTEGGLLIHCFDSNEASDEPWLPSRLPLTSNRPCANCPTSWSWDLSASLIFREQTLDASGEPSTRVGHNQPRDWLFGGGCVAGGIIFRPGPPTRIVCGNGGDCGGYCHEWCAPTDASTPVLGPSCKPPSSWRPEDVHIYLQRETAERRRGDYRNNVYNEFLVDGRWWTKHLPATVDAIVTGCDRQPDGSCDGHSSVGKAGASGLDAEQVHKKFLRKYGLSAADVPLLEWTGQVDRPFRIAGTQYGDEGY